MTISRTEDPENPPDLTVVKAATLFGTGSGIPSGPAVMTPRRKVEHMIAIDPLVRILNFALASTGPSTHASEPILHAEPHLGVDADARAVGQGNLDQAQGRDRRFELGSNSRRRAGAAV